MDLDILIKDGCIVNGTGNPWFRADVGIRDGRIVDVGSLPSASAQRVIEAKGLIVAPGFIDTHTHTTLMLLDSPHAEPKVMQGVTTDVVGVDGLSVAPITRETVGQLRKFLAGVEGETDPWDWFTLGEYFERLERGGISVNLASMVGNGTIRLATVGFENRPATGEELETMKGLLAQSMDNGALGLSSGLIYPPSMYADTRELIELCREAARRGGIYVTHIRSEEEMLLPSIREAIEIGEAAGIPVHISHLKAGGRANWGRAGEVLAVIDEARARGVDVTADQYPYTAGSTTLVTLLPTWVMEGGVDKILERLRNPETRLKIKDEVERSAPHWGEVTVSYCRRNKGVEGKTLEEVAALRGVDPSDALIDLLIEEETAASMIELMMSEEDVRTIMRHPAVNVCTDGLVMGKPHPRLYGSFPAVLGRYVRREGVLTLEDAVRKMTSLPARVLGLRDRGLIAVGMCADVVVFDPQSVLDRATYGEPRRYP
ncbi:MAG: amidohydrolase family protein, partial [Candidatus Geothermarchaeales archaeon]